MWYFTWILGALLACSFGIINALWLENNDILEREDNTDFDENSSTGEGKKNSP